MKVATPFMKSSLSSGKCEPNLTQNVKVKSHVCFLLCSCVGRKKRRDIIASRNVHKRRVIAVNPTCSSLKKGEFKFHLNRSSLPLLPFLLSDLFKKGSNNLVYDLWNWGNKDWLHTPSYIDHQIILQHLRVHKSHAKLQIIIPADCLKLLGTSHFHHHGKDE